MNNEIRTASAVQQYIAFFMGLIVLYAAGVIFSPQNLAFHGVSPHPYFILSCTMAAYLGTNFAFNFSFVASCMYMALLNYQTDYEEIATILDFQHLTFPVLTIVISCFFGEIRSRYARRLKQITAHDNEVDDSNNLLIDQLALLQDESFKLKKQLVNKLQTFQSVLDATRGFQSLNERELVNFYFDTISRELEVKSAVLYKVEVEKQELIPLQQIGKKIEHSIKLEDSMDLLIEESLVSSEIASIGELDTSNLKQLSEHDSLIAIPIDSLSGNRYLVSIYQLPFLNYSPSNIELIRLLLVWLSSSLEKSHKFNGLISNSIFSDRLEIYTYNYLLEKLEENWLLKSRYGHDCFLFQITFPNLNTTDLDERDNFFKIYINELKNTIRSTDVISLGKTPEKIYVLLPYLTREANSIVLTKVKEISKAFTNDGKLNHKLGVEINMFDFQEFTQLEDLLGKIDV